LSIHNKVMSASGRANRQKKINDNLHYQTKPELEYINKCLAANIKIQDGPAIPYTLNGEKHIYYIDFETDQYLVEIKGFHHWYKENLASGKIEAKNKAAIKYAATLGKKFKFILDGNEM